MIYFLLLLQFCNGNIEFISPMSLQGSYITHAVTSFSNPGLIPIYGKFISIELTPECELKPNGSDKLNSKSIAIIDATYNFNCMFDLVSSLIEEKGAVGVFFIVQLSEFRNYFFDSYSGSYVFSSFNAKKVSIVALIVSDDIFTYMNMVENDEIWVKYIYTEITPRSFPRIQLYITGDYKQDQKFIDQIILFSIPSFLWTQEFTLFLICTAEKNSEKNCYNFNERVCCLPGNDKINGKDKIINTILIQNALASTSEDGINTFFNYLTDLYSNCNEDYSPICNENQLIKNGFKPNYDEIALYKSYNNTIVIPSVSISDVYIYNSEYVYDFYYLSSSYANEFCDTGCSYSLFYDNKCSESCNNTYCGYDNMNCIQNICYDYMIGNGVCDTMCTDDPDCIDNTNNNTCTDNSNDNDSDNDKDNSKSTIRVLVIIICIMFV